MTERTEQPQQQEAYVHEYEGALTEQIVAGRTAETHGAFFYLSSCRDESPRLWLWSGYDNFRLGPNGFPRKRDRH